MPNERVNLSKQIEKENKRLEEVCYRETIPTRDITSCSLWLRQEEDRRKSALEAIKTSILSQNRFLAIGYLSSKIHNIYGEGILLSLALQKACTEYDQILKAEAQKPILGEIAFTVMLTVLPELKLVGRAVNFFKIDSKTAASIVADSLDNQMKDIIEGILDPVAENSNLTEQSEKLQQNDAPKLQMMSKLIKGIGLKIAAIRKYELMLYNIIAFSEDPNIYIRIKSLIKVLGFEEDLKYKPEEFELFSDYVLYEMLKSYCKQYCRVNVGFYTTKTTSEDIVGKSDSVEGLNAAQRKMIINKFDSKVWKDRLYYPPINNSQDLVTNFRIKFISSITDKEIQLPSRRRMFDPVFL